MRRLLPLVVMAAALTGAAQVASAAMPSPPTVPGWPRSFPAGPVLQGPQGGLVLVAPYGDGFAARAFRRDGRRLWTAARGTDCGNCEGAPGPVIRQPDGTFGPIGRSPWAVDPRGRFATPCIGVMFPDGSCVGGNSVIPMPLDGLGDRPAFTGVPAGRPDLRWTVTVPGYLWLGESAPMTVRDAAGVVYAAFITPTPIREPRGASVPGILVAMDPVARRILWVVEGPATALTGLTSGVLVEQDGGLAAYRPDGTVAWRRAIPAGEVVTPRTVVHDPARGRLYVGRLRPSPGAGGQGVTALDPATGAQRWRTVPGDRARLLSVGRGGRVYLAIGRPDRLAVRAVRAADGAAVWQRGTRLRAQSARELVNGTVAVSAGDPLGRPGVLTLLDPR